MRCIENKLVAIGVIQESQALLAGNHCMRSNGVPPIIAIKDQSNAVLNDNEIVGGGVAAVLVQGSVRLFNNRMIGRGHSQENKQGTAVWVWEGSDTTITSNTFRGYLTAVKATGSQVFIDSNHISDFRDAAILVKDSREPAHVLNNVAVSDNDPPTPFRLKDLLVSTVAIAATPSMSTTTAQTTEQTRVRWEPNLRVLQVSGPQVRFLLDESLIISSRCTALIG
jgi:hypothetical protein